MSSPGPTKRGTELCREIESAECRSPALWWLGHAGFALKFKNAIVYVDPLLSAAPGRSAPPLAPSEIRHAGLVLATHDDPEHLDGPSVLGILSGSKRAKLVLPKSAAESANRMGIPYSRMVTTDNGLHVEYLDDRIYAVPSSHGELDWTPLGGYPYLGYLIRFGDCTIYHAGDCVPYPDLVERLRPFNVTVALLPIGGRPWNFEIPEAAQLAEDIRARWLVPMHYGPAGPGEAEGSEPAVNRFIAHMLGHRPEQKFKIFECGEMWRVPPA
jgi:L-ascorbate metabolism protein UlaG (beta-lactamase superfamily)